jgi:hypothetical protein
VTDLQPLDVLGGDGRWIVQVTLATKHPITERMLDAMANLGEPRDITVAARADEPGMVFTVEVSADQVNLVPRWAFAIAAEAGGYGTPAAPTLRLVDLRAVTPEIYEAEALRPDTPEMLAATDVAEVLKVSRQRVHQLHSERADFPAPYARLGSGPIWTRPAIEAFDRTWTRRPGRPAKAS